MPDSFHFIISLHPSAFYLPEPILPSLDDISFSELPMYDMLLATITVPMLFEYSFSNMGHDQ